MVICSVVDRVKSSLGLDKKFYLHTAFWWDTLYTSGSATPGQRSNGLAERSTALAPPCLFSFLRLYCAMQCEWVKSLRTGEPFAASGILGALTWLQDFLTSK